MGPELVKKSIYLIVGNFGTALRATAVPLGVGFTLAAIFAALGGSAVTFGQIPINAGDRETSPGLGFVTLMAALFCAGFGFLWAAVSWHRFVLLEEVPGIIPNPPGHRIGAYLGASIRLIGPILIMFVLLSAAVAALGGLVLAMEGSAFAIGLAALLGFGLTILVSYGLLRFSLALPAAAIGEHMGVFESWRVTAKAKDAILIAAALLAILNGVLNLAGGALAALGLIGFVISLAISWFVLVLGLSILTAIYGHVVENRPL